MYTESWHCVGLSVGATWPHGVLTGVPLTTTTSIWGVATPAAASSVLHAASAQILASWKKIACRSSAGSKRFSVHTDGSIVAVDADSGWRARAAMGLTGRGGAATVGAEPVVVAGGADVVEASGALVVGGAG